VGLFVIWVAWRGSDATRHGARRVIVAMIVGGILYLPWVPTLMYQTAHTGTPWGDPTLPWNGFTAALGAFAGAATKSGHGIANVLAGILVTLALLALFGRAIDARHVDLDLRTRPVVRWQFALAFGVLLVGLTVSYVGGTAFDPRYAAEMVPIFVLVCAVGLNVFASDKVRVGALALVVLLGIFGGVRNSTSDRTQAGQIAASLQAGAQPGDMVVYCPDQLGPAVHRILGDHNGLVELTFPRLDGPKRVNWVDYIDRIAQTDPQAVAKQLLDRAGDHNVWLVSTPGYRGFEQKCEELAGALGASRPGSTVVVNEFFPFYESMGLTKFGS